MKNIRQSHVKNSFIYKYIFFTRLAMLRTWLSISAVFSHVSLFQSRYSRSYTASSKISLEVLKILIHNKILQCFYTLKLHLPWMEGHPLICSTEEDNSEVALRVQKLITEQYSVQYSIPHFFSYILSNEEESPTSNCIFWVLGKWLFFKEAKIIT